MKAELLAIFLIVVAIQVFPKKAGSENFPKEIQAIQKEVSQGNYPYISDDHYDTRAEFLSGELGRDCEDYALEKARRLRDIGYNPARLEIWLVRLATDCCQNAYHAVLVIDGQVVLDNMRIEPYYVYKNKWLEIIKKTPVNFLDQKLLE